MKKSRFGVVAALVLSAGCIHCTSSDDGREAPPGVAHERPSDDLPQDQPGGSGGQENPSGGGADSGQENPSGGGADSGQEAPGTELPDPGSFDPAGFVLTGDPTSAEGATWTYNSVDEGITYQTKGILFKPAGEGPFPAVVISHGQGGSAYVYGRKIAKKVAAWGMVGIATNYTFATAESAVGSPGVADIDSSFSQANLQRAHKCIDILRSLGYVDMHRLAVHGHSRGAFMTTGIAGAYSSELKVASHTAGGIQHSISGLAQQITIPYSIHHGDRDTGVALRLDVELSDVLAQNDVAHELWVYDGYTHGMITYDDDVWSRIRAWYDAHGMFDPGVPAGP